MAGAEQIVGNLASKVLTSQGSFIPIVQTAGSAQNALQALDIFLVQANTNVLVAQFVPLVCNLFLQTQIPSTGGNGMKLSDIQDEKDTTPILEGQNDNTIGSHTENWINALVSSMYAFFCLASFIPFREKT